MEIKMKLSIECYDVTKVFGYFEGLKLIKDAGFDCFDMSYYWLEEDSPLLSSEYREYAAKLRAYIDSIGLECNQAHAPFDLKYLEEFSEDVPNYLKIARAIESAAILGAKAIVVHSLGKTIDGKYRFDYDYNLKFFRSLLPYAERFGINIAVENLFYIDERRKRFGGRLGTPEEITKFVRELNSPYFVVCVDTGHSALTGTEPEDFIIKMDKELLKCLHIQDGDYLSDTHVLPYQGKFNWEEVMKSLKAIGYDGELTFEVIKFLRPLPNDLIPAGLAFVEKTGRYLISLFDKA